MPEPQTVSVRPDDAKLPADAAPPAALPRGSVAVLGVAVGAGWVGGAAAATRFFGTDAMATLTVGAVAAIALVGGLARGAAWPRLPGLAEAALLGRRLLLLGAVLAAAALVGRGGAALAWTGAGTDSGPFATALARVLFAAVLLLPVRWAAGPAVRSIACALPEGAAGGRSLAVAGALAVTVVALAGAARWIAPADPGRWAAAFGAVLFGLVGGLLGWRRAAPPAARSAAPALAREEESAPPAGSAALVLPGLGVGFAAVAFGLLGPRLLVPALGNELPGVPVGPSMFAAGLAAGAILGATFAQWMSRGAGRAAVLLLGGTAMLALGRLSDWGSFPTALVAALSATGGLDTVEREALRLAATSLAPPAILVGAAATLLAASLPGRRNRRPRWIALTGSAVVGGAVLGAVWAYGAPGWFGLDGALLGAGLGTAVLAVAAAARLPGGRIARFVLPVTILAGVTLFVRTAPRTDREALLVDRNLRSGGSLMRVLQKHWLTFDEDDDVLSTAILQRGHMRRLLVNGRFEASNETTAKTHGMLAHLPLLLHPDPQRVLVIGAGTGWAVAAAAAYPLDRIDVFDVTRAPFRAAARMGPVSARAFGDARVRVRIGDPEDLLARSRGYDVVLLEPAGAWTERSHRTSTRGFLELLRDRLGDGGLACQWIPDSALTREGFLVLLATWARVFPRVEVWAAHGGSVLVLANRDGAHHDFARLLERYREAPIGMACEVAWVATPETILSQFLVGDATVRRLTRSSVVNDRNNDELAWREAARRRVAPTVDPVPGLARIRDDVVATLVNTPVEGFAPAIARAVRARDLERQGLDAELGANPDEAIRDYREAIELNPRDGAVRRAFASLRSQQGIEFGTRQSFFAAHQYMREAVETDTTYAQGFANLGLLLTQSEKFDYAIACTGQAIDLAPDDDLFRLQMGRIWKQRGYYDKALPFYEQARELNPLNVEAAIGWIDAKLAMEGDEADLRYGLDFLEDLRALDPEHEDLLYRIGKLNDALSRRAREAERDSVAGSAPGPASP